MTQPTLHTERLRLVPLAEEHRELESEVDSDPEVMRYLTGRALSRAEIERAHRGGSSRAQRQPGMGYWVGFADLASSAGGSCNHRTDRISPSAPVRPTSATGCCAGIGAAGMRARAPGS